MDIRNGFYYLNKEEEKELSHYVAKKLKGVDSLLKQKDNNIEDEIYGKPRLVAGNN